MATNKLLKRIVAPDIAIEKAKSTDIASELHDYTHGINSDPLALLAIVFSALIHDVDHRGVSNAQLIQENKAMGDKYRGKSVAEQNSLGKKACVPCEFTSLLVFNSAVSYNAFLIATL